MKLYELQVMNNQLLELLEKEEITQEDYEDNKQMLVELLQEKSESLIFVNMEFDSEINRLKEVEKMLAEKRKKLEAKQYRDWETDRKSTRLNSSHSAKSRMPSSA